MSFLESFADTPVEAHRQYVPDLIARARELLAEERPMAALEHLTAALRAIGGERAVMAMLQQTRENYWASRRGTGMSTADGTSASNASDGPGEDIASLLARCSLAAVNGGSTESEDEISPLQRQFALFAPPSVAAARQAEDDAIEMSIEEQARRNPHAILAESGRIAVLAGASDHATSTTCGRCGAIISVHRQAAHEEFWCSAAEDGEIMADSTGAEFASHALDEEWHDATEEFPGPTGAPLSFGPFSSIGFR
eukprot:m.4464 g.4464  ORF g.4464 m.4464 type:complete len:253 (-) comp2419_c0_seq1:235-993(-)